MFEPKIPKGILSVEIWNGNIHEEMIGTREAIEAIPDYQKVYEAAVEALASEYEPVTPSCHYHIDLDGLKQAIKELEERHCKK